MTTPHHPRALPRGVTPWPRATAARPPGPAPASAPAQFSPRNTARLLCDQLRMHGLSGLYAFTSGDLAVVSLPRLTIWITTRTLYWTRHGQTTTWPAADTTTAARHLAQLTRTPTATPQPRPANQPARPHPPGRKEQAVYSTIWQ
jgi:hypothetical protein